MSLSSLDTTAALEAPQVKGSVVRGLAAALAGHKLLEPVGARLSPPARALLIDPPLPTMWVDARLTNDIYQAVYEVAGLTELVEMNREAITRGLAPLLRLTIERVLSIFGTSPGTLLARLPVIAGATTRGLVYRYEPVSDTSGRFDMEFPALTNVPVGPFAATGGALAMIFDLCKVRGHFTDPEPVSNGRGNRMRYTVTWQKALR